MTMPKIANLRKSASAILVEPVINFLVKTHITPNALSLIGFGLTLYAGLLIVQKQTFFAGVMILVSGFFDMLDGALARRTNQATKFGAILDSTLDRLSEAALLLCIMALYAEPGQVFGVMLTGVALVSSLMVSYLRSRIEAMGLPCKEVGFFTRSERVIVLALGLILARVTLFRVDILYITLGIIACLSIYTAAERLYYAWQQTKGQ